MHPSFDRSVFINCPFDEAYEPILQAILFCVVHLGFHPRIARERADSADVRIEKIVELIESARYSIHDLSRAQSSEADEYYRLNMPFEFGIDWACRRWREGRGMKSLLILEEKPYRYQATLSDVAGSDIQFHNADHQIAVRKVRNWLVGEAGLKAPGAARILARYADFQGWYFEKRLADGFSEDDIRDYPTPELLRAMVEWMASGQPITAAG